jgi:ribosomal protein L11 methyltransferase
MAEALADLLLDVTGNGVSVDNREVDTFTVDDLEEPAEVLVKGYLPEEHGIEESLERISLFLREVGPDYEGFRFEPPRAVPIDQEDWATSWKANFRPERVGRRLMLKPTWEEFNPQTGDLVLELDPGMAFGTGTHATTRLCLETVDRLAEEGLFAGDEVAVLDVGCGSGVLAIAAALYGARRVVAIDIDPVAVSVAQENALLNRVAGTVSVTATPLAEVPGRFELVLANILAEDLVRMAGDLTARVAPGGRLVLSGILVEKESLVREGFARTGLEWQRTETRDEWCCIVYGADR